MAAPTLLIYNLNETEMMGLRFLCAGLKIAVRNVPASDYGQPLAALALMARMRARTSPAKCS